MSHFVGHYIRLARASIDGDHHLLATDFDQKCDGLNIAGNKIVGMNGRRGQLLTDQEMSCPMTGFAFKSVCISSPKTSVIVQMELWKGQGCL